MHNTVKNLLDIQDNIKVKLNEININNYPKIIAVSKTFKINQISPLIDHGHIDFGENKVQEAIEKWTEVKKINPKIQIFLQVNIGDEGQKSGVNKYELKLLVNYCKEINLDLIGLMCIPPANINPEVYFDEMKKLNSSLGFEELSMGMSSDFIIAAKHQSTFIRVGSGIFGQRS